MGITLKKSTEKLVRHTLVSALFLLAVNAFGGGYYGMSGARDIPVEWLKGSPFPDYFIPGLFLFIVIGGSALTAAVAVLKQHYLARRAAFFTGAVTLLWIVIQVLIIGYVSWMQPATAATALLILFMARLIPKNNINKL